MGFARKRDSVVTTLYRFFDEYDRLLYIGIAGNPGRRFNEHTRDKSWWSEVRRTTMEHFGNRMSALTAETKAITSESPIYNIVHNRKSMRRGKWRSVVVCKGGVILGADPTLDFRIKHFDHTLLFYMAKRMDHQNILHITQRQIAAEMKTREARISEAIGRLREADYLETEGYGLIRINPDFYWRDEVIENEKLTGK
jgi:predicted GIY-YIG superfamily endonuclease